ncbi:MAG: SPOR domain-containing protein [Balneola sp.]|nr:MAG: SPOR domain-containing protein [Balneola sp.]
MSRVLLAVSIFLIYACSGTQPVIETNETADSGTVNTTNPIEPPVTNPSTGSYLDSYRSTLSDTYQNKSNPIPDEYARIKVEEENKDQKNLFEGYRVQLYSGRNVAMADTIASIFRAWSDTTIVGYQAETYTFFKTPYYKVHVGNFHDRDRAIYYSNLLKRRFREAWVVYDRVDPWNVPSDTTMIYAK